MRAASLMVLLGGSLLGCPRKEESTAPSLTPMRSELARRSDDDRCTLAEPRFLPPSDPLEVPWLGEGPEGPRVIARASMGRTSTIYWRDRSVEDDGPTAFDLEPRRLGWTGRSFVGVADGRLLLADARFENVRPVRRASLDRAVSITAAGREGGALVAWLRAGRQGDVEGVPWACLVGPEGELLSEAQPLPDAPTALRALRGRWDFGRFVVEGETVDGSFQVWSWVLEPDGRSVWSGPGPVACPQSGCVRVSFTASPSATPQVIRLVPLGDPSAGVATPVAANDLLGLAVSGDRVLFLHSPVQGDLGCAIDVYHLGRRQLPLQATSRATSCGPGGAVATPEGFMLLEVDGSGAVAQRPIACGDDA